MNTWKEYKVELRASPDTPEEELAAKRRGRVLGPQTVIYRLYANSSEEAAEKAIKTEQAFLYRRVIALFMPPILIST